MNQYPPKGDGQEIGQDAAQGEGEGRPVHIMPLLTPHGIINQTCIERQASNITVTILIQEYAHRDHADPSESLLDWPESVGIAIRAAEDILGDMTGDDAD